MNALNGIQPAEGSVSPHRIRLMPEVLSNKIAAGEVVQRPAAVVKELVENALDAEATRIEVRLQDSGKARILVQDNGVGMSAEDAVMGFKRHATSKIQTVDDLERLETLGFRGEALASIAAVAQVTIRTRRRDNDIGYLVEVHGGKVVRTEPCAMSPGTFVDARNLFYNVPARRNFLKTPATELKRAVMHFQALAISRPAVSFELYHNESRMYHLPAAVSEKEDDQLQERLLGLFKRRVEGDFIRVAQSTSYLSTFGFLGAACFGSKNRRDQFLFVNGRYVHSRLLGHAIASAYEGLLQEREYPFFALFMELDTSHVDVNVHPTKMEVKFDDERGVYSFVKAVCQRAIATGGLFPTIETAGAPITLPVSDLSGRAEENRGEWRSLTDRSPKRFDELTDLLYRPEPQTLTSAPDGDSRPSEHVKDTSLLWQLHDRYVFAQVRTGLLIVDQRAARERILYERSLRSIEAGSGASQQLLFPHTVELDPADFALVQEILPELSSLGFSIDNFGGHTIVMRGIPADVRQGREHEILGDLLRQYQENRSELKIIGRDNVAKSMARHGVGKGGERLSVEAMRMLIDQLFQCKCPYESPYGRATMIKVPFEELDARFMGKV